MALKYVTGFMVMVVSFAAIWFVGLAVLDPLLPAVQAFDLGGMSSQTDSIHVAIVKYSVPVFIGSALIYAVIFILREERQTIR